MDKSINNKQHSELIMNMKDLIEVLNSMEQSYFIRKHIREAKDWLDFLVNHTYVEELESLEEEIAERYTLEYDVLVDYSSLEMKRHELIEKLLKNFNLYLHGT